MNAADVKIGDMLWVDQSVHVNPNRAKFYQQVRPEDRPSPGWGEVVAIEGEMVRLGMDFHCAPDWSRGCDPVRPVVRRKTCMVHVSDLRTRDERPIQWAARILGLEVAPAHFDKETGRMYATFFTRNQGRLGKLCAFGEGGVPEPFKVDVGSAVGQLILDPREHKFMRFEGVGLPYTDVEEEQDAISMYGKVWGALINRHKGTLFSGLVQSFISNGSSVGEAKEMAGPLLDTVLVAMAGVVLPEGVRLQTMECPVGLFDVKLPFGSDCRMRCRAEGVCPRPCEKRVEAVTVTTTRLGETVEDTPSTHAEGLRIHLQRFVDRLPKPCTLVIYTISRLAPAGCASPGTIRWAIRSATIETPYEVTRHQPE